MQYQAGRELVGSDEDGFDDSSSGDSAVELKEARPCCFCCTMQRFYHCVYIVLFLAYMGVFPLWAKWLITAPMPTRYWHDDLPPFPMLSIEHWGLTKGVLPGISMSAVPQSGHACNYSCGDDYLGYRSNLMNFEVNMALNEAFLEKENVHTTYPVLLASEDFDTWQLVADRRHAQPEPFFRSRTDCKGQVYTHTTEPCISQPINSSFITQGLYVVGCVTWSAVSNEALAQQDILTNLDLARHCSSLGGVCGWTCDSNIPMDRMTGCSMDGKIDKQVLSQRVPNASHGGDVSIFACSETGFGEECMLSMRPFGHWPCHQCQQRLISSPEDEFAGGDGDRVSGGDEFDLWSRRLEDDPDEEEKVSERYLSLPRMQVRVEDPVVPPGLDVFNAPKIWMLTAPSLDGPWKRLYNGDELKGVPVDTELPKRTITRAGGFQNSMELVRKNRLTINSESCFGKRGPLYLVACAVNSSIYDDESFWRDGNASFKPGQKVFGPPFNDRCVALAGRCGMACSSEQHDLRFCSADGYIHQELLVGEPVMQYNRLRPVFLFILVLLCGFAVRGLMLCPGIFSPYRHAHDYDPEMTFSFKYIVVVAPVAGADENKGTMIRNLVGAVSCMPPECQCRYHVVVNDEGHRKEMLDCWEHFCNVVKAVPDFGKGSYERNLREFTHAWCAETRNLTLSLIGGKVKQLEDKVLDRLCGVTALKKLRRESLWRTWDMKHLAPLESAMKALSEHLRVDYNKFTNGSLHLDVIADWEPRDRNSASLRMHYTSRAKPQEDARNIMVQHVAVGTWYYKVPKGSDPQDWLALRARPKEMVYALPDNDEDSYQVPLRSSHGKAGGLNFVDNYMTLISQRRENQYGDEQDNAPTLYAIADARHQFQPDFMLSCIPCFFRENGDLNERVAFTQAPQHYPEYADSNDYMDYNNAQFFRLNAMIRNCCGGCSSCGTNGMWLLPPRDDQLWAKRTKRVRDADRVRRQGLIEREQFHTSCKIEDTASSLDQVLVGRYSHFVNRKLSFGMAKAPTDFIGAQQRWVEGAVTLALQWFSGKADSHGEAARNGWMLWATVLMFAIFIGALIRLVVSTSDTSIFVEYGIINRAIFHGYFDPIKEFLWNSIYGKRQILKFFGANSVNVFVFSTLMQQMLIWYCTMALFFLCVICVTMFAKILSTCCCRTKFPNELRWWGRLMISMDNLTYFVWFWTSFFWVGFNYYTALFEMHFHFNQKGMMGFMLVVNLLNWGLIICNSSRYSVMESVDANEVAALSMDNIWRSNQLFFMTGPIQLFSIVRGFSEYIKYRFYGQDIGGWSGGDLGTISVNIVKYWTTFLLLGCAIAWVCHWLYAYQYENSFAGCVVITMVSLDVLHPCVFLWFGKVEMSEKEIAAMSLLGCLTTPRWWQLQVKNLILNKALTTLLKFLAPAYFLLMPLLALSSEYFGMSGAYLLVSSGPGH